jgi:hypothetical protein
MNFKELDAKLSKKIDLKEKYPGYFTMNIFRLAGLLVLGFLIYTLYLNNWSIYNIDIKCNYGDCPNQFYMNESTPKWICDKGLCDNATFQGGFRYGRTDYAYKNQYAIFWGILGLAILLNHLWYCIKNKTLIYKGKEHHESNKS